MSAAVESKNPGGRPRGKRSVNTLWVRERLRQRDFSPIDEMVDAALVYKQAITDKPSDESSRSALVEICRDILPYTYPKLKHLDGEVKHSANTVVFTGLAFGTGGAVGSSTEIPVDVTPPAELEAGDGD